MKGFGFVAPNSIISVHGGCGESPWSQTVDLAVSNDRLWRIVCERLGWRFVATV